MPDCLFCRIAEGEIPAELVHETESVIAFHDIAPSAPTHVLVVPRTHFADIAALVAADPALASQLASVAASVAAAEGIGTGWRLVFNTGSDAGQTVFHVHGHVLGGRTMRALG